MTPESRRLRFLSIESFPMVASGITLFIGFLALIGWIFDLPGLVNSREGSSTMAVNAAVTIVLAGGSLGLQRLKKIRPAMCWLAWGCASLVLFVGVATLGEYMFGLDFGIDQLLLRDPFTAVGMFPGRMSVVTALCFVFTGLMLLLLERPAAIPWVQGLALTQVFIAGLGFINSLYGAEQFIGITQAYTGMTTQMAFSFVALSLGILSWRSNEGIVRFVTGPGSASIMARRLLPMVLVVPVIIGWLRLMGERAGLYNTTFGLSITTVLMIVLLTAGILYGAKSLHAQESNFQLVVEAAPNAIVMVNREGKITLVNSQTETLFGYAREELLGQKVEMLVPERYRTNSPGHREGFLHAPKVLPLGVGRELYGLKKDGAEVPIEIGINPVTASEGIFVLASIIDITERKSAEASRNRLVEDLAKVNKELESFAYVVSHDLKAPLRGINSLAEWIAADSGDRLDEKGKKQLGMLQARVQKMHALIDGILEHSRIGRIQGEIEFLDLNSFLSGIVELLDPPSHIKIEVQKNLPVIQGEKIRVHQLFQNILSNAIKYNDKPQGRIQVAVEDAGAFWRFKVSDNGPGIDEKYHERIFELFQTLGSSKNVESTGIGLSLVKKIVENYGGTIGVQSKPGQGSTFLFTYPKTTKMYRGEIT